MGGVRRRALLRGLGTGECYGGGVGGGTGGVKTTP